MTLIEKRLQRFLQNPVSFHFREIETLLFHLGFKKFEVKGSHKKFKHISLQNDLIIPVHNNDCKDFYKKFTAKIIKKYF